MIYALVAIVAFLLGVEYNEWRWNVAARKAAQEWWEQYKKENPNWRDEIGRHSD